MHFNLLGEYSGLHQALKIGLECYGHKVFLLSDGDNKKQFSYSMSINNNLKNIPKGQLNAVLSTIFKLNLPEADCTSFISPLIIGGSKFLREFISLLIICKAQNMSNMLSLCAAGSDSYWLNYVENNLEYNPFDENDDPIPAFKTLPSRLLNHYVAKKVDRIIGFSPDYYYAYASLKNLAHKTYYLPMLGCRLLESIPYKSSKKNKSIRILFGSNKKKFKGAQYIYPALKKLSEKYSDIEIINPEMCSIDQWVNYVKNCDILVDQCRTYSYGVNTLYGLAYGKCVLSSWRWDKKSQENLLGLIPPIISIRPSIDSVYEGLVKGYKRIKFGSHNYQEVCEFYDKFHSPLVIADKFLSIIKK